jgi:hypothetical protein
MTPHEHPPQSDTIPMAPPPPEPRIYQWYHKMSAVVFIAFCVELGLSLLIYPWTEYWSKNYFSIAIPALSDYWDNVYLRGAISGLGVVNLYISFIEIFRLRRFARR